MQKPARCKTNPAGKLRAGAAGRFDSQQAGFPVCYALLVSTAMLPWLLTARSSAAAMSRTLT